MTFDEAKESSIRIKEIDGIWWCICGNCGSKLFQIEIRGMVSRITIKCEKCKAVNKITEVLTND